MQIKKAGDIKAESFNDFGSYRNFLQSFIDRKYEFIYFDQVSDLERKVILRHDIDFDTDLALLCAQTEASLNIRSTYFFLLRSYFYNIFSIRDFNNIIKIRDLGHKISIHFDAAIYTDFKIGLKTEKEIFKALFNEEVKIISIHRPNDFFLNYDEPILDIEHTYQSKFCKKLNYYADSTGKWRYGNPIDSYEFKTNKSFHILIHPVWWYIEQVNNYEKLKFLYKQRVKLLQKEFAIHCLPFRDIQHEL